jgi:crotonobetainyl-CoA:carnitine CoA-transferase CaiB-like acyl-CoA transferase/hydroxyacyl-ACP dehydratase HTD2-like protein with hotdog domain
VVSIEQAVAAPLCSLKLADAGARVIKVERGEGDFARDYDSVVKGQSAYFVWLNHGKESLVLNLKDNADRDLLVGIISAADIFIQNLAPGAAERLGLGSEFLRNRLPRLISCDISGYGNSGPYRDMKAYDLLIQCETGLASITGSPDEPGRVGVSICDIACGMNAYSRILEALHERRRTGTGSAIQVSLFNSLADWMNVPYLHHVYGGRAPERVGIRHPSIVPYGAYQTGDGVKVVIGIQNDREFQRFCDIVCERPELARDARFARNTDRVANRQQLDAEIGAVVQRMAKQELVKRLGRASIAFGSLNSVEEFSRHPQLEFLTVETDSGTISLIAPPGHSEGEAVPRVPSLGEHSDRIRAEFGGARRANTDAEVNIDLAHLQKWVDNPPLTRQETLGCRPASGLSAMLGQSDVSETGAALPPLWQWLYFTPSPLSSELGPDGHPKRGGFLPPVPLPRRMWAAGKVRIARPLFLGESVRKQSRIEAVKLKQGRFGQLVFVTVGHKYFANDELRIDEKQTLVYVGNNSGSGRSEKAEAYAEKYDWARRVQPDPVMLFRYSALTGNTHRIHYDRDYAVNEEGLAGLLVHAPLTATLLAGLVREHKPDSNMTEFQFRALRPLADTHAFSIHGRSEDNGIVALWALDADGQLAVEASARVVPQ